MAGLTVFSSGVTWIYKVVFPLAWLSLSGTALVAGLLTRSGDVGAILIPLLLLVFGGAVLIPLVALFKRVQADDRYVYIYGLRKAISVPLSEIESVQERLMIAPRRAFIVFRGKTPYGKSVLFIPAESIFSLSETSWAVTELRRRAGFEDEWRPR